MNNKVKSNLFTLSSVLYELVTEQRSYESLNDETIETLYMHKIFLSIEEILLRDIILRC